jgi:predicted nucleic acid-binding protein
MGQLSTPARATSCPCSSLFKPSKLASQKKIRSRGCGTSPSPTNRLSHELAAYPLHLGIDDNTVEPYSLIRSQIWHDHATPKGGGNTHKEKQPEDLTDRVSGKSLGIDERDLLIASTAAQYGLVLVTNDSNEGMKRIESAAQKLELDGKPVQLRIELWP